MASAVDGVRPIPPATFSPLAVTKSMPRSSRSSPRSASTATRPGLPIRSPIISTRQAPCGRGALPLAGLPRRVRPMAPRSGSVVHARIVAARGVRRDGGVLHRSARSLAGDGSTFERPTRPDDVWIQPPIVISAPLRISRLTLAIDTWSHAVTRPVCGRWRGRRAAAGGESSAPDRRGATASPRAQIVSVAAIVELVGRRHGVVACPDHRERPARCRPRAIRHRVVGLRRVRGSYASAATPRWHRLRRRPPVT